MLRKLTRGFAIPLVALLVCSGCYNWVPIEPHFANGQLRTVDEVSTDREREVYFQNAVIKWPVMQATDKDGNRVTIDLRRTPVVMPQYDPGQTAAVIVPSVILGIAALAGIGALVFEGLKGCWLYCGQGGY